MRITSKGLGVNIIAKTGTSNYSPFKFYLFVFILDLGWGFLKVNKKNVKTEPERR
jgi:hypothetical protein